MEAKGAAVANRAPEDAAQDVTTSFIRRLDAICNSKAQSPDVIGNHAEGDINLDLFLRMGSATVPVALLRVPRSRLRRRRSGRLRGGHPGIGSWSLRRARQRDADGCGRDARAPRFRQR